MNLSNARQISNWLLLISQLLLTNQRLFTKLPLLKKLEILAWQGFYGFYEKTPVKGGKSPLRHQR